jgi:hypothetical protein
VTGAFTAHALMGHPAQLVVDERHEIFERGLVAATPLQEELGDVPCHDATRRGGPSSLDENYAY